MHTNYKTPQKFVLNVPDYDRSGRISTYSSQINRYDGPIDYKTKTYDLLKTLTQMQIRDKQSNRTILYLQRQIQTINQQIDNFIISFGVRTLAQVKQKALNAILLNQNINQAKISVLMDKKQNQQMKQEKVQQQYSRLIKQYKNIITTQQDKLLRYQNRWKDKQSSLIHQIQGFRLEQTKQQTKLLQINNSLLQKQQQIQQLKQKLTSKQKDYKQFQSFSDNKYKQLLDQLKISKDQCTQQSNDLKMIKQQFRQLIIEKQTTDQKYQKLKKKYKQEIDHFQMIQKQVQEKLIQVEKEINFYKQQRQDNQHKINQLVKQILSLKKQRQKLYQENQLLINSIPQKQQFSFCAQNHISTQTDQTQSDLQNPLMSIECYQASIKSLLDENSRLKRALLLLDRKKQGQSIPAQAQLQLKLLKNIYSDFSNKETKHSKLTIQIQNQQHQLEERPDQMVSPKFVIPQQTSTKSQQQQYINVIEQDQKQ